MERRRADDIIQLLAVQVQRQRAGGTEGGERESESGHILRRADKPPLARIVANMDGAELERMRLRLDSGPVRASRDAGISGEEIYLPDFAILGQAMAGEEIEHR